MSPIFYLADVEIVGSKRYTSEDIKKMIRFEDRIKLLNFVMYSDIKKLKEESYFESVKVTMRFPNEYKIKVQERRPRAYIPYPTAPVLKIVEDRKTIKTAENTGVYLYVDREGRVLEANTKLLYNIPIISGVCFTEFKLGEKLDFEKSSKMQVINRLSDIVEKYQEDDIIKNGLVFDLTELNNIKLYLLDPSIEVLYGKSEHDNQKIIKMIEIVKKIPKSFRGTLDMRDINRNPSFRPLT